MRKKYIFVHVPKCGGTTVEKGLLKSGFQLNFYDPDFFDKQKKWNKSSPQHITAKDLKRLIDIDFFDYCFTVVRDPISRFLSAFNHNRGGNTLTGRKLPWHKSVDRFIKELEKTDDYFSYRFDNHFVPADSIVPHGSEVFYLEHGLDPLKERLSEMAGISTEKLNFGKENKKDYNKYDHLPHLKRIVKKYAQPKIPRSDQLKAEQKEKIKKIYERDYKRFFPERLK